MNTTANKVNTGVTFYAAKSYKGRNKIEVNAFIGKV